MRILALNPGSSSLKQALYEFPEGVLAAESNAIEAVGIRVVHGGSRFVKPVRVDDAVVEEILNLRELAPLHNPIAVRVIKETRSKHPGVPIVAVFDTSFHQTMPAIASSYAVPQDLEVRRYGFHGISYSWISSRVDTRRHIVCHLGNGASVCAVLDGRSIDTSMGFTPMEGLVMGTRAGDLDPGVILYLLRKGKSEAELDDLLNHNCGLLGVSGTSGDVRELEKSAAGGDKRAEFALELFAYRVAKYIGAYAVVLGGVDAVTFTAGIGEHSPSMRSRICRRLGFLGVELDGELNRASRTDERRISRGPVDVWVIPTNEELEIARMTYRELQLDRS
ncbi:MAG TPA: acetate/propionate family kinase [Thermoanaerobaculia bacterium]|nr:acetate/propionate family kinase [Thermoanaerobaculia bacterium]